MCPLRRSSSGGLFTTPARGPPRRLSGWASGHVQAITRGHRGSCIGFPASWRPHARPRGAQMMNSESMATWIGRGLGHWRCPQLPPQPGASFMHSFVRIALAAFRPRVGSRRMPRARGPPPSWSAALPRDPFLLALSCNQDVCPCARQAQSAVGKACGPCQDRIALEEEFGVELARCR